MARRRQIKTKSSAFPPVHPGAVLREDVLPASRFTVAATAKALGISRQLLHGILRETKPVTPETALRLGKLFGNGPTLWLRMQQEFDLWHAARSLADDLKRIETHAV